MVTSDPLTAPMPDFGAEPPNRGIFGALGRLRHRFAKPAASDAFGQGASDDPFAFDDGQEARFRRRRRIIGLLLILLLLGGGAGAAAYIWLTPDAPPPSETVEDASSGTRVVQPMPPVPGPENLGRALMAPPGSAAEDPDARRRAAGVGAPEAPPAAPQPQPAAKPQPPVPTVAMPAQPTARRDRETASAPPRLADLPRPSANPAIALSAAPISDLQRRTPGGLMVPTVASDGRKPWQVYARPFTGDRNAPKIAVVLSGLGLMASSTDAAIEAMPPDVTLAFDAAAPQLADRLAAARRTGHETLIEIGVQSRAFPAADPGPEGLLTGLTPDENRSRLERALSHGGGYVGVLALGGEDFAGSAANAVALTSSLRRMGLALVATAAFESEAAPPPKAHADVTIDAATFRERISAKLREAEAVAKARGGAVVVAEATPLALAQIAPWIGGLKGRGFEIAPVSALVKE